MAKKSRAQLDKEIERTLERLKKLEEEKNARRDLDDRLMGVYIRNLWGVNSKDELVAFLESHKKNHAQKIENQRQEVKSANADLQTSMSVGSAPRVNNPQPANQPQVGTQQVRNYSPTNTNPYSTTR